jgi:hypothetical protein
MTYEQFLFMRLAEEVSEYQKELFKCQRFGPNHVFKNYNTSNLDLVKDEWIDVLSFVYLLLEQNIDIRADYQDLQDRIAIKRESSYAEWKHVHSKGGDPNDLSFN